MRTVAAAFRLQIGIIRRVPDYLLPAVSAPLMGIVFLLVIRDAGREDLVTFALVGPVLIGLWHSSLNISGEIITGDRGSGVLEALVATPTPVPLLVLGRVLASIALGLIALVAMVFIAVVFFRLSLAVPHPWVMVAALVVTALAAGGHAVLMAATFVLGQSSRPFQRALSFPFYVLGGVVVPVTFLPDWAEVASHVVFLSWSAELLRDALDPAPVSDLGLRLAVISGLGLAALVGGWRLTISMLDRGRRIGSMTYA